MSVVVLLSGGMDSTISLYWAIDKYGKETIYPISFDYGQKHRSSELGAAAEVCIRLGLRDRWKVFKTDIFEELEDSALLLTSQKSVNMESRFKGLPASYVPGRNIYFLTIAAMYAVAINGYTIVGGMCQMDYSGYPDCRGSFIGLMEAALSEGFPSCIMIETPLMYKTKAQSVILAKSLLGCMEALAWTHTCYEGMYPPCKKCNACKLREKGFSEAGISDPIFYR